MSAPTDVATTAVVLRPGDRVLLCTPQRITAQEAQRMKDRLGERFPDVEFTIADSITGVAVYRDE